MLGFIWLLPMYQNAIFRDRQRNYGNYSVELPHVGNKSKEKLFYTHAQIKPEILLVR